MLVLEGPPGCVTVTGSHGGVLCSLGVVAVVVCNVSANDELGQ